MVGANMKLGINNLSDKMQLLDSSLLYCISCDSKYTAINVGLFALLQNKNDFSFKYLILDDISQNDILTCFNAAKDKLQEIKAHVYSNNNKGHLLKWMVSDLKSINALDDNSFFVIIAGDTFFKDTRTVRLSKVLESLKKFARINKSTILLISYWLNQYEVNSRLLKNSSSLDGIQSIKKVSDSYDLNVFFWTSDDGETSHGMADLELTDNGFNCLINKEDESYLSDDYQDCYVVGDDFKPDRSIFNVIEQFPDNQSMYETAMRKAISCSCFFTVFSKMDIEKISEMIYKLRQKKGKILKIFLLDNSDGLRANSASFLMDCGLNFIFDNKAKGSYINTVLPSLKNITLKNEIHVDYQTLKERYYRIEKEKNGYLEQKAFVKKVAELLSVSNEFEGDGVLVFLKPNKISIEAALGQFKPKRGGDYCTIADGHVVVFLPSCRNGDLSIGLKHVFNTDYDKIFASYFAAFTKADIVNLLRNIENKSNTEVINFTKIQAISKENELRSEHLTEKEITEYCIKTEWAPMPFDLKELKNDE